MKLAEYICEAKKLEFVVNLDDLFVSRNNIFEIINQYCEVLLAGVDLNDRDRDEITRAVARRIQFEFSYDSSRDLEYAVLRKNQSSPKSWNKLMNPNRVSTSKDVIEKYPNLVEYDKAVTSIFKAVDSVVSEYDKVKNETLPKIKVVLKK